MRNLFTKFNAGAAMLSDWPLLFLRICLAYGFYEPAMNKWSDIHAIGDWFAGMGLPAPYLQAYLAASTELLGVFLLALGLGTRYIAIPLMVTLLVAIKTVHWENGFSSAENGFEIPLYYLLMLFSLFVYGGGRVSVDFFLRKLRVKAHKI